MFHDLPHGVLRFGQDQPKRPDRMDFSETVENDPFVNAGKERGGVGLGRGAIAKDDHLQFAEALRGYVGLWKVLVFSRKPQEAKFFFLCGEVFLKFLYLRLSSRAMQMAEVMIEPLRWRASPKKWTLQLDLDANCEGAKTKGLLLQQRERSMDGTWQGGSQKVVGWTVRIDVLLCRISIPFLNARSRSKRISQSMIP